MNAHAAGPGRRRGLGLALASTGAALLGACVTPPQTTYTWGSYEDLIYAAYLAPGDVPAE